MSTEFINDQWRLPNAWNGSESNVNKQSNYSMDFDGSNYISLPSSLDLGTNSTISLWFKSDSGNTNNTILGEDSYQYDYLLQIASGSNEAAIRIGGIVKPFTGITEINDGNWNHWCIVRNGDSVELFINNSSKGTQTGYGTGTNTKFEKIGAEGDNQFPITGKIDAVSVFDYALSASQITTLYGSSSTGIGNPMSLSPKPVAYYPLGDQDAFNGANYLVPNSSLKDYVFDFNGSNNYINIASAGGIALMNTGVSSTVSLWVYPTGTGTRVLFEQQSPGRYVIYQSGTSLFFYPNSARASFTNLILNQWYNVITIVDGSNSKFYVNGNEVGTSTSYTPVNTLGVLQFGRYPGGTQYFEGKLSNVQIFNTALPATGSNSVETLYNNGSPLTSMSGFTSLQGWWKLDASATYDSSTTTWTIPDDSTNSNDGTSSGMTQANLVQSDLSFTSGYSPYALDFDSASSDYIQCSTLTNYDDGDFSVSIWLYRESGVLYGRVIGNSTASSRAGFDIATINTNILFSRRTPTKQASTNYIDILTYNTWHNVVGTYNDSTGDLKLYLDGVLKITVSATSSSIPYSSVELAMGTTATVPHSQFLSGKLSNASIWNTALTSAQVTEIYSEGIPQNLLNHSAVSSLVSWWQLGSNSSFNTNWTVLDEKGSNNGTSVNMTEADIVDGVGSYANGLSSGMGGDEVIGDAPYSTANALSVNMDVLDRVEDTPS
jgi:hypothetical protein